MPTLLSPFGADQWSWIDRLAVSLFDVTLSAILFFSFVLLAILACRQPARRILIARVAFLASLAIIPMARLEFVHRVDVVGLLQKSNFIPRSWVGSSSHNLSAPSIMNAFRVQGAPNLAKTQRFVLWIKRGLVLIYLAGVGIGSAGVLLGFAGVKWLIRHSRTPTAAVRDALKQVLTDAKTAGRSPEVQVSSRVQRPVVVGLIRPMILIPEQMDSSDCDQEHLRLAFLHELAHISRGDHWFGTIASVAQSLWFLLPHTWWLRSQLLIDQEFLADYDAAIRYGRSSDYASSLLSMASGIKSSHAMTSINISVSSDSPEREDVPSALFQRMLMLLHCPFKIERQPPFRWSLISRLLIVTGAVLSSSLMIRWDEIGTGAPIANPSILPIARFRLEHFVVEPLPSSTSERSIAYVLPIHLPPTYDLDVEVYGSRAEVHQIRVGGHPLKASLNIELKLTSDTSTQPQVVKSWHRIHLHRDHRLVSTQIDDDTVCSNSSDEPMAEWLTIEPGPRTPTEFRNLTVSW